MQPKTSNIHPLLLNEINGQNLMDYTTNIAKEVRLSGSPKELRAFQYVKEKLESFGIETQLIFQDAYISIPKQAQLKIDGNLIPCITHSMSYDTGEKGVAGPLIYISELSDMTIKEDKDLNGKIVLLEGIALPSSVQLVESLGAIGAIFINGPITHEMIVSTVWGNPIPDSNYPTIPVISVNEKDGDILKNNRNNTCWLMTEVDTGWRVIPALIAEIKGTTQPESFALFSGHIDSWHYGAMDNASANATMIEVARILERHKNKFQRSVRLAFWSGHSHGRYAGSAAYCDSHWEELHENCFLHFYADSLGGKGATILSESNCMAETKELARSVIETYTNESYIGKRFSRAGDQSFWGTGVPSLFMGMSEHPISDNPASKALVKIFGGKKAGGFGWWWHTTEDTIDKIDEGNLVRDCKMYIAAIFEACGNVILPINHRLAIQEMIDAVKGYEKLLGDYQQFSTTLKRFEELQMVTNKFYDYIESKTYSYEQALLINKGIMKISNILVPLNYVEGDKFSHDKAVYQQPLPQLTVVDELAAVETGSDSYFRLNTLLNRRLNKVNYTLLEANRLVAELVEKIVNPK